MYTNEKPYVLPAYAQTSLLSRARLMSAAVLAGGALCGGLLGLFGQQAADTALMQAKVPAAPASSVLASQAELP